MLFGHPALAYSRGVTMPLHFFGLGGPDRGNDGFRLSSQQQGVNEMAKTGDTEQDPALEALTTLSETVTDSARELDHLGNELTNMKRRRTRGWSWRRTFASGTPVNPLSGIARVVADLGRASGAFRRAMARSLRAEGMQVTEIATILAVTRQRVTALIRPRNQ
jgi:hypothetical protein